MIENLYTIGGAHEYTSARLGDHAVSMPGFLRHIYPEGSRELEPIRLESDDGRGPAAVLFTRDQLDRYIANRPHNAQRGATKVIAYPEPLEGIYTRYAALDYLIDRMADLGYRPEDVPLTLATIARARRSGDLEGTEVNGPADSDANLIILHTTAQLDAYLPVLVEATARALARRVPGYVQQEPRPDHSRVVVIDRERDPAGTAGLGLPKDRRWAVVDVDRLGEVVDGPFRASSLHDARALALELAQE